MLDYDLLDDTEGDDDGKNDGDDPRVDDGGDKGDGTQLPIIAQSGGTKQGHHIEDPQVAVGKEPEIIIILRGRKVFSVGLVSSTIQNLSQFSQKSKVCRQWKVELSK